MSNIINCINSCIDRLNNIRSQQDWEKLCHDMCDDYGITECSLHTQIFETSPLTCHPLVSTSLMAIKNSMPWNVTYYNYDEQKKIVDSILQFYIALLGACKDLIISN